ncbi:AAA family ATPase [Chryseobacterium sp. cx-311]|uniref:AAA family ATPase n=1 Tax=Marnyiella aurantia TaxID=2758037 RepID=UPI001AEA9EDE|nr:AAA family ATPase [Marnyiella aurantia]MBP0612323.1 AAA family ATPase [Marnyiella aurantia]
MLTEIKLCNVASYNEETTISDLRKINFFFGSNGTGKSTIGKYLQTLENIQDKKGFESCSVQGDNLEKHEILVFNQNFIETNFIRYNEMPGIFTLDETNEIIDNEIKKELQKIGNLKDCLITLSEKGSTFNKLKQEIFSGQNGVIAKCWLLRTNFNDNFKKMPLLEHSKNRENHYEKINKILQKQQEQNVDYSELLSDYKKLYEREIVNIDNTFNLFLYAKIRRLEVKINKILAFPFTGNKEVDIANMIESLGIQKWVEERFNTLDKTISLQKCPFCQEETVNQNLVHQFEEYFDRKYTEKKELIYELKRDYNNLNEQFVTHLNSILANYPLKTELNQLIFRVGKFFENQEKVIHDKIDNTNKELSISSVKSFAIEIKKVISIINSNNENFEKLDDKRKELNENIWKHLSFHAKVYIDEYRREAKKLDRKLDQIEVIRDYRDAKISQSELIIEKKSKQTADTETARKEINEILKSTGFNGFKIEKKTDTENNVPRYFLKRPEEASTDIFSTLSEGEKNFIAFLYFFWLCKGTDDKERKKRKKIIVIDDPVSSLDSQALFVVTTVIRELAKKKEKKTFFNEHISQLLIFSHNLYFYNEVSYNNGYHSICQDIHHYQISKPTGKTIISLGSTSNKIKNDYNLMWRGLFELKDQGGKYNVVIGNLMRRIIQSYLQFTHNYNKERSSYDILKDNTKRMLYDAFCSQINKESHHVNPLEEMHFQRIAGFNELNNEILFEVFELYFKDMGGENHYNAMKAQ